MSKNQDVEDHYYGEFESIMFDSRREGYRAYTKYLEESEHTKTEIIENSGAFLGDLALNRLLTLTEYFKMTQHIAGHIADVGTYKGASALLFAKLMKIYNPESLWQVHGFDWFKGTQNLSVSDSKYTPESGYTTSEKLLLDLVEKQDLSSIFRLHNIDLVNEINTFMSVNTHLQFRLVFMDAGIFDVMDAAIPAFWDRLSPGGIMVFDQLIHEFAPGEIAAVRKHLKNEKLCTLPNSWMPNAYIVKGG